MAQNSAWWFRSSLSFLLGVAVTLVLAVLLFGEGSVANGQNTQGEWVVTGHLRAPGGGGPSIIRLEDPEMQVVCYTRYSDLSGDLACVKK